MANPYRALVDERHFLNLPGFHAGAYVIAYVEDTSGREIPKEYNVEPRTILELADCSTRINLEFEVRSELAFENSLHKIDTLVHALSRFREGLVAERARYAARQT